MDVESFGNPHRTNRVQVAVREGLYRAMNEGFRRTGIPWIARDHEDRGDGMFILVGSEVPKSLFVESLPSALAAALYRHNRACPDRERIRLRMALHAGEVNYDEHGVTGASGTRQSRVHAARSSFSVRCGSRAWWRLAAAMLLWLSKRSRLMASQQVVTPLHGARSPS